MDRKCREPALLEKAVGTVNHTLPVNFVRCMCGGGGGVPIMNVESPRSQAPNLNSHLHYSTQTLRGLELAGTEAQGQEAG